MSSRGSETERVEEPSVWLPHFHTTMPRLSRRKDIHGSIYTDDLSKLFSIREVSFWWAARSVTRDSGSRLTLGLYRPPVSAPAAVWGTWHHTSPTRFPLPSPPHLKRRIWFRNCASRKIKFFVKSSARTDLHTMCYGWSWTFGRISFYLTLWYVLLQSLNKINQSIPLAWNCLLQFLLYYIISQNKRKDYYPSSVSSSVWIMCCKWLFKNLKNTSAVLVYILTDWLTCVDNQVIFFFYKLTHWLINWHVPILQLINCIFLQLSNYGTKVDRGVGGFRTSWTHLPGRRRFPSWGTPSQRQGHLKTQLFTLSNKDFFKSRN